MGRICQVSSCCNNVTTAFGKSFHQFPKDAEQCRAWVEYCNSPELDALMQNQGPGAVHKRKICSDHFTRDWLKVAGCPAKGLRQGAVPNVYNNSGFVSIGIRNNATADDCDGDLEYLNKLSMSSSNVVFSQCRCCLRLLDPSEIVSLGSEQLHDFVQQVLLLEIPKDDFQICEECFSMWNMVRNFMRACQEANTILLTNAKLVVRKPWMENDDQKQMLNELCRMVRRSRQAIELLHSNLKNPPETGTKESLENVQENQGEMYETNEGEPEIDHDEIARHSMKLEDLLRLEQDPSQDTKDDIKNQQIYETTEDDCQAVEFEEYFEDSIKHEDPLDVDDSNPAYESERLAPNSINEMLSENHEETIESLVPSEEPLNDCVEDAVAIVEPEVDQIDLVDSSSSDEEAVESEDYTSEYSGYLDEKKLKTVCQVCGVKTHDIANHLESHISDEPKKRKIEVEKPVKPVTRMPSFRKCPPKRVQQKSTTTTAVDRLLEMEKSVAKPDNPLQCPVCNVISGSVLAAKIHARLHPVPRLYTARR